MCLKVETLRVGLSAGIIVGIIIGLMVLAGCVGYGFYVRKKYIEMRDSD